MGIPETVRFLFEPGHDILAGVGMLIVKVKQNIIRHSNSNIFE